VKTGPNLEEPTCLSAALERGDGPRLSTFPKRIANSTYVYFDCTSEVTGLLDVLA